jgi:hypothetical protein
VQDGSAFHLPPGTLFPKVKKAGVGSRALTIFYWLAGRHGVIVGHRDTFPFTITYSWYSDGLRAGWSGFDSRQRQRIFIFSAVFRSAVWPTDSRIECVRGAFFLEVKWQRDEAHHSPPSNTEVRIGRVLQLHSSIRLHGIVLNWLNAGTTLLYLPFCFRNHSFTFKSATTSIFRRNSAHCSWIIMLDPVRRCHRLRDENQCSACQVSCLNCWILLQQVL